MGKLKLAFYWAASCGGCEITVLDLNERILKVVEVADILFWPVAMDFKYKDVETLEDKALDVCFFNGAIRNSENEHVAKLLRERAKVMVAFGSCAHMGGIPGLANLVDSGSIFDTVYRDTPSTDNPEGIVPQTSHKVSEGELTLPHFYETVKTLDQTVEVDYYLPGCPPAVEQVWGAVEAIVSGSLPPAGSVIGASEKSVCDDCPRLKEEKRIPSIKRIHQVLPDPEKCFLEQGIICVGSATRGGCGTRCLNAHMPCRGCYGPGPGASEQGAKMLSALSSVIASTDPGEIKAILDEMPDVAGTLYRFSLPGSIMRRAIV